MALTCVLIHKCVRVCVVIYTPLGCLCSQSRRALESEGPRCTRRLPQGPPPHVPPKEGPGVPWLELCPPLDTPTAAQDTRLHSASSRPSCPPPVLRRNSHPQATLGRHPTCLPAAQEQLTPRLGLRLGCDPPRSPEHTHSFISPLCTPPVSPHSRTPHFPPHSPLHSQVPPTATVFSSLPRLMMAGGPHAHCAQQPVPMLTEKNA